MNPNKKPTLQDIADLAGVTKVTVSKALRNQEGVSEAVKNRIIEIADQLKYSYVLNSRSYKNNKTNVIAVLSPELFMAETEIFYTSIFKYIYAEAIKQNYFVILSLVSPEDENSLILPAICDRKRVDAIIILGQLKEEYVKLVKSYGLPVVLLDFCYPDINLDSIVTDNIDGMYNATKYLISKGHLNIGFVGNIKMTNSIRDRYLGYYKAMMEAGIPVNDQNIIKEKDEYNNDIDIILPKVMPTAFVCNSDYAAVRLLDKLNEKHYNVPGDISLIGFDDIKYCITSHPKLTTVSVNRKSMAENAVTMALELVSNPNLIPRKVVIKTNIIERQSVKKLTSS